MMPKLRQALIEFEKIDDAIACVTHCQVSTIPVGIICTIHLFIDCFKALASVLYTI